MSINYINLKVHYLQDRSYCIIELQIASQKYLRQRYDQISREMKSWIIGTPMMHFNALDLIWGMLGW